MKDKARKIELFVPKAWASVTVHLTNASPQGVMEFAW